MAKKLFYSMGEVSEMFDVNPSLIRHWEQKFEMLKPHKNKKGNRMFTPQDVETLKAIYHLVKENGMTLAGARKRLKAGTEGLSRDMELLERLQRVRAELLVVREMLKGAGEGIEVPDPDLEVAQPSGPQAAPRASAAHPASASAPAGQGEAEVPAASAPQRPRATQRVREQPPAAPRQPAPAAPPEEEKARQERPAPRFIEQTLF